MRFRKASGLVCLWVLLFSLMTGCNAVQKKPPSDRDPQAKFEEVTLFTSGTEGYTLYRIPGIVVTGNGTVITYCEARAGRGDHDPMDVLIRRSTDGGNTWEPRVRLAEGVSTETTMNNPVMVAEKNNGTVHLFYCKEYATVYYRKSTDHGATWSEPVDLGPVFDQYKPDYRLGAVAAGPGHGIQLSSGRLVVPFWITTNPASFAVSSVTTLYSDDSGTTWNRG